MEPTVYLTSDEAADYLRLKQRKLYELVAEGAIPCSKVTGKWLFPRHELDRWVNSGLVFPAGMAAERAPPVVGGAHDLLLERALRQSGSGLALLIESSEIGLDRLVRDEVMIAAVHLQRDFADDRTNVEAVQARPGLHDAVIIAFAIRRQGLMVARGNPLGLTSLADVLERKARIGMRTAGTGAQLLLDRLLLREHIQTAHLVAAGGPYASAQDIAIALRVDEIDCGIATESAARVNGLDFVPLTDECFDLVMRRGSYFEPGPQKLMAYIRGTQFTRQANALSGYDISHAGLVRLNK